MSLRRLVGNIPFARSLYAAKNALRRYLLFALDFTAFRRLASSRSGLSVKWGDRYPCLHDKTEKTGFDRHYVFHTAWAARVLAEVKPKKHVDVSSSLYFCSIVSAFVPVDFYDYRPAELCLSELHSQAGDLLELPFADSSLNSLSCMHVVEHIGLGRYGDTLDPNGDLKAIAELKRVISEGGTLLFVVPVGKPRVMFNAHRIYSYEQIIGYFDGLSLVEFALIPDNEIDGGLVRNADPKMVEAQEYACGCFRFTKARAI